jgi:hypothetical protein
LPWCQDSGNGGVAYEPVQVPRFMSQHRPDWPSCDISQTMAAHQGDLLLPIIWNSDGLFRCSLMRIFIV